MPQCGDNQVNTSEHKQMHDVHAILQTEREISKFALAYEFDNIQYMFI
jgi:hypothetical protein